MKLLIHEGADVDAKWENAEISRPLDIAIYQNHREAVELLVIENCDLSETDRDHAYVMGALQK